MKIPRMSSTIQALNRIHQETSYSCSHVTQLIAEQRKDVILQHVLHLVFIDLFLSRKKTHKSQKYEHIKTNSTSG